MNIVTGYKGEPHITSQQKRNINIGIFGSGAHIIKGVGAELSATVISANEVQIADGMIMCEGCASEIAHGTTESMTIDNGTQGKLRIDLIVARYNRNTSTGVEDMTLIVIKGTPSASDPQSPAYISGSISDGDTTVDFPLYQVNIDGISITSITRIADLSSVESDLSSVENDIATLQKLSIKAVQIDFGSQGFDANGVIDRSMNVAQYIPSGYKLLTVLPLHSGSANAVIYGCAVTSANVIRIQVKRLVNTLATTEAHATILCVNRDMV